MNTQYLTADNYKVNIINVTNKGDCHQDTFEINFQSQKHWGINLQITCDYSLLESAERFISNCTYSDLCYLLSEKYTIDGIGHDELKAKALLQAAVSWHPTISVSGNMLARVIMDKAHADRIIMQLNASSVYCVDDAIYYCEQGYDVPVDGDAWRIHP